MSGAALCTFAIYGDNGLKNALTIPVTETLVSALAVQVELELGDVDQVIEEMADLCGELLDSHISIMSRTGPITAFAGAIGGHFEVLFGGRIPSEKVIR